MVASDVNAIWVHNDKLCTVCKIAFHILDVFELGCRRTNCVSLQTVDGIYKVLMGIWHNM